MCSHYGNQKNSQKHKDESTVYHSLAQAERIGHPTPQILAKAVLVTIARKWKQSYVLQPMDNGNVVLHSMEYYSVAERNEVEAAPWAPYSGPQHQQFSWRPGWA